MSTIKMHLTWKPQELKGTWQYRVTFIDESGCDLLVVYRQGRQGAEAARKAASARPKNAVAAQCFNMQFGTTCIIYY